MRIYLLTLLLVIASCDKPSSDEVTNSPTQNEEQVLTIANNFACDSGNCLDSIVAIDDGNNLCTGVVKDGKVLITNDCGKLLNCENVNILDINNGVNKCQTISIGEELSTITLKGDLTSLNMNAAILDKSDTAVKSISISKNNEGKYTQDLKNCALTFNSVYALNATKENSATLAIKNCADLKLGSVITQNSEVISLITTSDTLNLSKSLVCGDDCDRGVVDKFEFVNTKLINQIPMVLRLENLKYQNGCIYTLKKEASKNHIEYTLRFEKFEIGSECDVKTAYDFSGKYEMNRNIFGEIDSFKRVSSPSYKYKLISEKLMKQPCSLYRCSPIYGYHFIRYQKEDPSIEEEIFIEAIFKNLNFQTD